MQSLSNSFIFEDNHLLVLNKPCGVTTEELQDQLKNFIKIRDQKPGNVFLTYIHRLDRRVGGVLIFAKTSKAAERLSAQMRQGTIDKNYKALVWGVPVPSAATLEHFWLRDGERAKVHVNRQMFMGAKPVSLTYQVQSTHSLPVARGGREVSLLKIKLHSGKKHQIRAQLECAGYPILNDVLYSGNAKNSGLGLGWDENLQIALHATEVRFLHPTTREEKIIQCDVPANWHWDSILKASKA